MPTEHSTKKEKSIEGKKQDAKADKSEASYETPIEKLVESFHTTQIKGESFSYHARAGTLILKLEKDEHEPQAKAEVFFISYTLQSSHPDNSSSSRPLLISFNGGPGSSSVWLHMGFLGPKRVVVEDNHAQPLPPPFTLIPNDHSILKYADLVFIDPVGTGYSRAVPGEKANQFYEVQEDVKWMGEFIRLFVTRFKYWQSPKFLIGESYGTTRAAGLASYLQERYGMFMNGIFLVSSILDFKTRQGDFETLLYLPSMAATAWYHKQLNSELQTNLPSLITKVKDFCFQEYAPALLKGNTLSPHEEEQIAKKISHYTGLSQQFVENCDLRLDLRFCKELLRKNRRTVGRLDSRFQGIDKDAAGSNYEFDPSYALIQGPYTAAFNHYVRSELEFETDLIYEILTDLSKSWSYKPPSYANDLNVAESLRKAMSQNPFLKVHVANGYYDLATPFFATEYTFQHLGLDPVLTENISMSYYEAGHMMYMKESCLAELAYQLNQFITG